jgi:hypothetical protein
VTASGTVNYFTKSISYYSKYNLWRTSEDVLRRDFSRFKNDGVQIVNLAIHWYRLEGNTQGDYYGNDYGNVVLDGVKRAIQIAVEVGLKPKVAFASGWGTDTSDTIPDYVIDPVEGKNMGLAIVRCDEMRQAFLDMYAHTVGYLAGAPVWGWTILGEPWYSPRKFTQKWAEDNGLVWNPEWANIDQKENFITLMQELTRMVRSTFGSQIHVDINFVNLHIYKNPTGDLEFYNLFDLDWGWDSRIFQILNSVRWTFHPMLDAQTYPNHYEEVYSKEFETLRCNIEGVHSRGLPALVLTGTNGGVAEDGTPLNDDAIQANDTKRILLDMKGLRADGVVLWCWMEGDRLGIGCNHCKDVQGNPRLAYYEFIDFKP